ncbi:MAG: type II toxin-antitoxin system RelE/ParE family toxin [Planctomycetes bacterium]|nr:type II toxin-antitoxin system RelE/ParE family toxin [Planctomycetota bacterium]
MGNHPSRADANTAARSWIASTIRHSLAQTPFSGSLDNPEKPLDSCSEFYELRVRLQGVNYRVLYCFHGRTTAVVSHGIVKQKKVPAKEIDLAIARKRLFEADPKAHSE